MAFQEHAEIPLCPLFETWLKSKSFCLHTTPFSNFAPLVKLREKEIGEFSLDIIYCPKFFTLQITFIYMCCIFVYAANAYRCGEKRCQPSLNPSLIKNQSTACTRGSFNVRKWSWVSNKNDFFLNKMINHILSSCGPSNHVYKLFNSWKKKIELTEKCICYFVFSLGWLHHDTFGFSPLFMHQSSKYK